MFIRGGNLTTEPGPALVLCRLYTCVCVYKGLFLTDRRECISVPYSRTIEQSSGIVQDSYSRPDSGLVRNNAADFFEKPTIDIKL